MFIVCGNKIITSGGGGMLLTNNRNLAARARHLSTQAIKEPINYVTTMLDITID